jgi:hypothetical protein
MVTEDERAGRLLDAKASEVALFDKVIARGIIGKTRHWHKRIVLLDLSSR